MARTKYKKKEINGHIYFFHRFYHRNLVKPKDLYGKTPIELDKKIKKLDQELERGIRSENVLFGVYLKRWMDNVCFLGKKESTINRYESLYKNHFKDSDLYKTRLKNLTTIDVQDYYVALVNTDVSRSTLENLQKIIKPCVRYAFSEGKIPVDFSPAIKIPQEAGKKTTGVRRASQALSVENEKKLLGICKETKWEIVIITALNTGLRRGELLALTWNDLDLKKRTLNVDKTYNPKLKNGEGTVKTEASNRVIPIPVHLAELLKKHRILVKKRELKFSGQYLNKNLVFPNDYGNYFSTTTMDRFLKQSAESIGLSSINMHDFRDTYATRLYEKSGDLKMVQTLLGHADITTTANVYTHISIDHALEYIDKLDALSK